LASFRFPRLRATSLDTAEGEGDQLDTKILKHELEKTQDLVLQLSKQLSELKDQVSVVWTVKDREVDLFGCFLLDDRAEEAEATLRSTQSNGLSVLSVWKSVYVTDLRII
jgi:hypothetical protein